MSFSGHLDLDWDIVASNISQNSAIVSLLDTCGAKRPQPIGLRLQRKLDLL